MELVFHGTNAVVKDTPYYPLYNNFDADISLSDKDFELMNKYGINLVRIGVMWPGVEPTQGNYSRQYLDDIKNIISLGEKYGIYFLIDMHEDAFNKNYCGEGFPNWLPRPKLPFDFMKFPFPLRTPFTAEDYGPDGFLLRSSCDKIPWTFSELSFEMSAAYGDLYKNHKVDFANVWKEIALNLKDCDNIIAYELINEPFPGNVWTKPWTILPSEFENILLEFYDGAVDAIRTVDQSTPISFAGKTFDDFGSGFTRKPGSDQSDQNPSILAFHFYSNVNMFGVEFQMDSMLRSATRLNVGGMLTEFGISSLEDNEQYTKITSLAEARFLSYAYWEWKPFCNGEWGACITGYGDKWENDVPYEIKYDMYQRTFAYQVRGLVELSQFDVKSGKYELVYKLNMDAISNTKIYLSSLFYDQKVNVEISPKDIKYTVRSSPIASINSEIKELIIDDNKYDKDLNVKVIITYE